MTNIEKMRGLTVEKLARVNVKGHLYNAGYQIMCDYITTDGNIFSDKEEAVKYEFAWLNSEIDETDGIFNFNY